MTRNEKLKSAIELVKEYKEAESNLTFTGWCREQITPEPIPGEPYEVTAFGKWEPSPRIRRFFSLDQYGQFTDDDRVIWLDWRPLKNHTYPTGDKS